MTRTVAIDDLPEPGQFKCELCGEIFDKGWADEQALAEYRETFGPNAPTKEMTVVCEECYQRITAAYPPSHLEEDQAAGITRTIRLGALTNDTET